MRKLNKKKYLIILCICWLVVQSIQLNGEWTRMDDDAHYILHARSLVINHRYNDPHFVAMSSVDYIPKNASPGWPLMLVPVIFLFGINILVLKIIVIAFALLSGMWIYKVLEARSHDEWLSLFITGIYYFSMTTIVFTRMIYSEWPYLFISLIILYGFIREKKEPIQNRQLIYGGILLGVLLSVRFVAASLLFAVIAVLIKNEIVIKHRLWHGIKQMGIVLFMTTITYQMIYLIVRSEEGPGYLDQFLSKDLYYQDAGQAGFIDVLSRIPHNISFFINRIGLTLLGRSWHEWASYRFPDSVSLVNAGLSVLGLTATFFILLGFFLKLKKTLSLMEYYVLFYLFIMFVIWFYVEVYRYLMPIIPFLLFYLFTGVKFMIHKILKKDKRIFAYIVILFFIINVGHAGLEVYRYQFAPQNEKNAIVSNVVAAEWLKDNMKSNELIFADDPRWHVLETELSVAPLPIYKDIEKVYQHIGQYPESVVFIDQNRYFHRVCIIPVLQKYPDHFTIL